ncbi:sigma-70 family RNA polymerase sigma factor [Phytoactinopolyspora limicola]|uniref:sigma-70 family RNA polymerase sigma factor n=1 Tax=Phytoactinopolyspora limicola TaxID=2715536 RepID=UPI001409FEDE|nr:sigma-70 family RNA polymerase sigma factor [Phytoactinopolyspora limicola]
MEEHLAPGPSDADLVHRARSGDRDAFAAIYDRYADRLHDFCWSMLRNHDDAADATQDTFLRAVERLDQLREPAMVRAWLYSIARRAALARLKSRQRQTPADALVDLPDPEHGPEAAAGESELRELVWTAAAGLGDRDRVLLDLHLRQGLDGAELATAAGVRVGAVYTVLSRLRVQVERSLGALLVARLGRADCTDLDGILTGWDGRFSALIRKRVARHVDSCDVCGERRRTAASPMALLSTVPAVVFAPAELRDTVLAAFDARAGSRSGDDDGGPDGPHATSPDGSGPGSSWWRRHPGRAAGLVTAGVGAVVGGIIAASVLFGPDDDAIPTAAMTSTPVATPHTDQSPPVPPDTSSEATVASTPPDPADGSADDTTDPPAPDGPGNDAGGPADPPASPNAEAPDSEPPASSPGELTVSTDTLDLGARADGGVIGLRNTGGAPVSYQVGTAAAWLAVDHDGGELSIEAARDLRVTVNRAELAEGDHRGMVEVASPSGAAMVDVLVTVERPPSITGVGARPAEIGRAGCAPDTAEAQADISDESGVAGVELWWQGPDGSGTAGMVHRAGRWHAQLGPFTTPGPVTWSVMAIDARGNVAESEPRTLTVTPCPQ